MSISAYSLIRDDNALIEPGNIRSPDFARDQQIINSIRQLMADLAGLGITPFIEGLLNDVDAAEARTTLGVGQAKSTSASVATTSGTSIDFTGIPSGVTRITLDLSAVSTTGTSVLKLRLGDSGGVETTGYIGGLCALPNGVSPTTVSATDGFSLVSASAAATRHGTIVLNLVNAATFTWACFGSIWDSTNTIQSVISGTKSLSAALDRVSLTTVGGTDTFDAGTMNISWEF